MNFATMPAETPGDKLRRALLEYKFRQNKETAKVLVQARIAYEREMKRQTVCERQEDLITAELIDLPGWRRRSPMVDTQETLMITEQ